MNWDREIVLVGEARSGDRAAFRELVRHYASPVYRLAFGLTLDPDDALGLTADAFKRARAGIGRIQPGKRFFPWILRIVRNLAVTRARRNAGRPTAHLDAPPETPPAESLAASGSAIECSIIDGLQNLSLDDRMALALRIVERLPYGEIAEPLDQTSSATMARLAGARGALLSIAHGTAQAGGGIHLTFQQLSAFIDGELPEASMAIVQRHLSVCATCAATFGRLEEQEAALMNLLARDLRERATEGERSALTPTADMPRREPLEGSLLKSARAAWWAGAGTVLLVASVAVVAVQQGTPDREPTVRRGEVRGSRQEAETSYTQASLSRREANDPLWLEESVETAERIAAEAERAASADRFDAASEAWEVILPHLLASPEDKRIARREMARVRFRAWEIAPTPQRAAVAEIAVRAYLQDAPSGPDRDLASTWLASLEH